MDRPVKFIHREMTRHGKVAYYFRRDRLRVRLPDDYGSPAFWRAYEAALQGDPIPHVRDLSTTVSAQRADEVEAVVRKAVSKARQRAVAKGLPFDLTPEWAVGTVRKTGHVCPETNIPFLFEGGPASYMRPYAPSIDRRVPADGYTVANCRIIVFALNAMISDWGEETMHRIANGYRYVQGKKRRAIPAPCTPAPRTTP